MGVYALIKMSTNKKNTTCQRSYQLNIPQMLSGGMSENWLLKELGDVHWSMISKALNSQSDEIVDSNGERLYASFVRISWDMKEGYLSAFKENEKIALQGELSLYGNKMFFSKDRLNSDTREINAQLMSVFSSRKAGNNVKLTKGKPLNVQKAKVSKHETLPSFASEFFELKSTLFPVEGGNSTGTAPYFSVWEKDFPLQEMPQYMRTYEVDPYDDINGVGLLYFASYPKISDKCERYYFEEHYERKDGIFLNWAESSSCLARDIHYYGNVNAQGILKYTLEQYTIHDDQTISLVSSLYREKDGKCIAKIFTVKKLQHALNHKNTKAKKYDVSKSVTSPVQSSRKKHKVSDVQEADMEKALSTFFTKMFPKETISRESDLRPLALESISYIELSEYLNVELNLSTSPGDFFGLYTIQDIIEYILKPEKSDANNAISSDIEDKKINKEKSSHKELSEDIAIVGMSFVLPGGIETKEAFWEVLERGDHVIETLPEDRWKWPENIDPNNTHIGIDKGGFISDIRSFDANFFAISPLEAEIMDPQQRKLLEVCWHCLEDSGIPQDSLKGTNTGVFVGASGSDYARYVGEETMASLIGIGTAVSVLANRISHMFDLKGPSIQLDTACSSSLVALHQAVQAIRNQECEQALVAGVNCMLHPLNTEVYYNAGMLNTEGLCKTFDEAAAGYVRGEGVLAFMIKPLSKALETGQVPYAVIKGSAVNHGGNIGGFTVPNPHQQASLIEKALADAQLSTTDISYVEAHGTGTKLGDPIEINGLRKVFGVDNQKDDRSCHVGSVKTNIGHLEAAAGLAGLAKVLLAFQHKTIPPLAHFNKQNSHISLADTPFILNKKAVKWELEPDQVRVAGVSSFGSGGTNAHVIVADIPAPIVENKKYHKTHLIVISGDTQEALLRNQRHLKEWVQNQSTLDIEALSYHLLTGRTHLAHRAAFVVSDKTELVLLLSQPAGETTSKKVLHSENYVAMKPQTLFAQWLEEHLNQQKDVPLTEETVMGLAELFIIGNDFSWKKAFAAYQPRRINLPKYVFKKTPYWIETEEKPIAGSKTVHALIHENQSVLGKQQFRSNFTGSESFFKDHQLQGIPILPGVACLEMVRYVVKQSIPEAEGTLELKQVFWKAPVLGKPIINTALVIKPSGVLPFSITNETTGQECFSGEVSVSHIAKRNPTDLGKRRIGNWETHTRATFYNTLQEKGYQYGPQFQTVSNFQKRENEAWSTIQIKREENQNPADWNLGLLDGALQTALYAFSMPQEESEITFPFSTERFCSTQKQLPESNECIVHAYRKNDILYIDVLDQDGNGLFHFENLIFRSRLNQEKAGSLHYLIPQEIPLTPHRFVQDQEHKTWIVGYGTAAFLKALSGTSALPWVEGVKKIKKSRKEIGFKDLLKPFLVWLSEEVDFHKNKVKLLIALQQSEAVSNTSGILGALTSLQQEEPSISFQVIEFSSQTKQILAALDEIYTKYQSGGTRIAWDQGVVTGRSWKLSERKAQNPWRDEGIYLISGGAGGIGKSLAEEIVKKVKNPTLLLIGKSVYDADKKHFIKNLEKLGAKAIYEAVDITSKKELIEFKKHVSTTFGSLNGIIHAAGANKNILWKQLDDGAIDTVLDVKINGVHYLDSVWDDEKLDFFWLFSSIIPIIGNMGQVLYGAANGYLDDFTMHRTNLVKQGKRQGKTISINWPYWLSGGMQMPKSVQEEIYKKHGMKSLTTEQGLKVFQYISEIVSPQVLVTVGNPSQILKALEQDHPTHQINMTDFKTEVIIYFKNFLADFLKRDVSEIDEKSAMENYGIDSIMIIELTRRLETLYGKISKTLFFEYKTILELVDYFIQKHPETTRSLIGKLTVSDMNHKGEDIPQSDQEIITPQNRTESYTIPKQLEGTTEGIAIIGMSGRYPKAANLEQFWDNLVQGLDCITEIPEDRWDYKKYYDPKKGQKGKTYSKWGGFIDDVACFDPLFFNITPLEATYMDPQERLFLQCAYATLEDAGYTRQRLQADGAYETGPNIGVFAGVMYEEYQLYGAQLTQMGHPKALGGIPASIANRVSHYFDFHGPSMGVDTMCSSGLTAIDLACKSLYMGDCEAALAGAVNTSLHPNKYLMLAQGNFVSAKGKCESFGIGGEGYVPGEGVGVVMLKKISKAIEDGDQIYGVIRSSAINHGGKTNGYTVPNPQAQAAVIKKAIQKAGINPDHISYVEAHGTGTALGDPIEIAGLNRAFSDRTTRCPIGSVKSNIGHCESAAGISGLTKVLLQLKHKQLVPSLHAKTLNPNIDFEETIFQVQQQLEPWKHIEIIGNGIIQSIPRIAAISSFGAGGANAHLIVEEYAKPIRQQIEKPPFPIILSAKTKQQLLQKVGELEDFLQKQRETVRIADIAYTLQIGRESMRYRMAMVSNSLSELLDQLQAISEESDREDVYFHTVSRKTKEKIPAINTQISVAHKAIANWLEDQTVDWESLPSRKSARIISLPTYPFAKEVYWPDLTPLNEKVVTSPLQEKDKEPIHWLKKEWYDAPYVINEKQIDTEHFWVLATPDTNDIAEEILQEVGGGNLLMSEDFVRSSEFTLSSIALMVDITPLSKQLTVHKTVFTGLQRLIEALNKPCSILGVMDTTQMEWAAHTTLYKCLGYEYKNLQSRSLIWDRSLREDSLFAERIVKELRSSYKTSEIRIFKGVRQLPKLEEVSLSKSSMTEKATTEKVVWITGGTRGIGLTCAKHLVKTHGVTKLVLSGKTSWPSRESWYSITDATWKSRITSIQEIEALGATIRISAVDLTNKEALKREIIEIEQEFGPIGMLFHAAGIADFDTPAFVKKNIQTIEQVLQPKKQGTRLLLEVLSHQPIDQVVLFSSVSSVIPSLAVGQLDYAIANTYLDLTAGHHSYPFDIVSIQWPNWKESGMGEVKSKVYSDLGLRSITDQQGFEMLDQALCLKESQVLMPAAVSLERWNPNELLALPKPLVPPILPVPSSQTISFQNEENPAMIWLIDLFSSELHIPKDRLEIDRDFGDFGVDSIILTQLMRSVNAFLETEIDPSIFYEYSNIERLSQWIYKEHEERFEKSIIGLPSKQKVTSKNQPEQKNRKPTSIKTSGKQEYAIIGVSCQFPDAPNIEAYWELISKGEKAIREIPTTRWNRSNAGYAALLNTIDEFDTSFFMVAPEDAISMDPQALLILEETLHLLYQSGYSKETLKRTQTGVYLGARSRHLPDENDLKGAKNPIVALGQNYLAANVSQYFDFQGPSLVIDTACSSALTALDIACKDLMNGDIDQAVIGGVNILQTDEAQKVFDQRGILNTTGDFHVFDARVKGVILGEGIGMMLIKKLEDALRDGDKIEAVLSGLAINNDGRTAGHATPNIEAQKGVMQRALQKSNLTASQISHIEVNGSGTEVTDLIELKAIKSVYPGNPLNPVSLGSIKPNIGHPLCAEGMASLLKLIGMLKYQRKVPFLSGQIPMKHFDLTKEGYVLERATHPWEAPLLAGAINCFADGGTNAHAILRATTESEQSNQRRMALPPPKLHRIPIRTQKNEKNQQLETTLTINPVSIRNFWKEKVMHN